MSLLLEAGSSGGCSAASVAVRRLSSPPDATHEAVQLLAGIRTGALPRLIQILDEACASAVAAVSVFCKHWTSFMPCNLLRVIVNCLRGRGPSPNPRKSRLAQENGEFSRFSGVLAVPVAPALAEQLAALLAPKWDAMGQAQLARKDAQLREAMANLEVGLALK